MQGLADGYFVLPYTLGNYLARPKPERAADRPRRVQAGRGRGRRPDSSKLLAIKGKKTAVEFHRELGKVMWENVGMARTRQSLEAGDRQDPRAARRSSGRT